MPISQVPEGLLTELDVGVPNGVASLDGTGRLPTSELTFAAMEYKGLWDATTNTPSLTAGIGNHGDFYRISVEGTQDLGYGATLYKVGGEVIYNAGQAKWDYDAPGSETVLTETFESVSKNLKAWDAAFGFVDGQLTTITYTSGLKTVVKTFGYTDGQLTSMTLSGDTPVGIKKTKTFTYTDGVLSGAVYSA